MLRPLIYPTIALMGGIAAGYYYLPLPVMLPAAGLIVLLIGLMLALKAKMTVVILPVTAAAMFCLGFLNISHTLYVIPPPGHIVHHLSAGKMALEGIIDETPQEAPEGQGLVVALRDRIAENRHMPVTGRVMLQTPSGDRAWQYGDLIRFRSHLQRPHNFHNPGSFDYEKWLRAQDVLVQGKINTPADIVLTRPGLGNKFKMAIERARDQLRRVIAANANPPAREIIQALLLGETKPIPPLLREDFNRTGTSHILAISGLNVALVASFAIFSAMLLMKSSPYLLLQFNAIRVATITALIPVVLYTLIAGMGISVLRAAIMLLTFLLAVLLRKDRDLFNTLALAALIILLISPYSLFDISFQLSFAAVASLIFVSPLLGKIFWAEQEDGAKSIGSLPRKIGRSLSLFVLVSLSATLGTLPIIAYAFNGFSTITLLANLVAVPLLGMVALALGLAVIVVLPLSATLAGLLVKLTALPVGLSVTAIKYLASLPGSYVFVTTPSLPEITCYYLLFIVIITMIRHKVERKALMGGQGNRQPLFLKLALAILIIFFAIDAIYLAASEHYRRGLEVTAIDVGQGGAALIRLPGGKDMLIDGGGSPAGSFDVGKFVLAPYLRRQRIGKLDLVILTHAHPDHFQGLLYVLKTFPVREVWTNSFPSSSADYQGFLNIIQEKNILHRILRNDVKNMMINGAVINVLNAGEASPGVTGQAATFHETNDTSLVVMIAFGNISFLLPGDISAAREKRLLATGGNIRSDVLFAPHHGSLTSSSRAFLQAVRPHIAVISCGFDNIFNLPHPEVLARYAALPARIYRTDQNGAVSIATDGKSIKVRTVIGK